MLHGLGFLKDPTHFEEVSAVWFDEWQLNRVAKDTLKKMGSDSAQAEQCVDAIRMMITEQRWYSQCRKLDFSTILRNWMTKPEIQRFLKVNRFEDQVWFDADAYTDFEELLTLLPVFESLTQKVIDRSDVVETILGSHEILTKLHEIKEPSEYKLDKLMEAAASLKD